MVHQSLHSLLIQCWCTYPESLSPTIHRGDFTAASSPSTIHRTRNSPLKIHRPQFTIQYKYRKICVKIIIPSKNILVFVLKILVCDSQQNVFAIIPTVNGKRKLIIDGQCFYKERQIEEKEHCKCVNYQETKCPARVTTIVK